MRHEASRRTLLGGLAALPALTVPVIAATDPHVAYRPQLHAAYAEKRLARPIASVAVDYSIEDQAATLVMRRTWKLCDEVLALPTPQTLCGLGVLGLAAAINLEGLASLQGGVRFEDDDRAVAVARAILAITREPLPEGFEGWGDEPGYFERESAYLESGLGSLPAWAIKEAKRCA